MLGRRYRLFEIFGFEIGVDASWVLIAGLVTFTLATNVFPHRFEGLSDAVYWTMGVAGSTGLFASIVFHELGHALVARRVGIHVDGITLFLMGGVAEMEDEPADPKAELWMAAAGPVASLFLAGLLIFGSGWAYTRPIGVMIPGTLEYLGSVNLLLALFNLLPAFPLDGGRILRALLWLWRKDELRATRTAARTGTLFGHLFFGLALLYALDGEIAGGVWWALIGVFVHRASKSSYRHMLMRHTLIRQPVHRFMLTVTAPATDLAALHPEATIDPDTDAYRAMSIMSRSGKSRLLVARHGELLGIVALRDLVEFLTLRLDLELQRA